MMTLSRKLNITLGRPKFFKQFSRVLLVSLVTTFVAAGCANNKPGVAAFGEVDKQAAIGGRVVESMGIKINGLVLSSAGYMLDMRYRVLDVDKAASMMNRKIKPYLLVEATGMRIDIPNTPKLGLLRQLPKNSSVLKDREYFLMFANPGHVLKNGDKVSMVVGDLKIENLSVQ